jgi:hypothetical protein
LSQRYSSAICKKRRSAAASFEQAKFGHGAVILVPIFTGEMTCTCPERRRTAAGPPCRLSSDRRCGAAVNVFPPFGDRESRFPILNRVFNAGALADPRLSERQAAWVPPCRNQRIAGQLRRARRRRQGAGRQKAVGSAVSITRLRTCSGTAVTANKPLARCPEMWHNSHRLAGVVR